MTDQKNNKIFLNLDVEKALRSYLDAKGLDEKTKRKYWEFFRKYRNVHGELNQANLDEFLKYNNYPSARAMVRHLITAITRWDFPQEIKEGVYHLDITRVSGRREKKKKVHMSLKELEYLIGNMKGDSVMDERNRLAILTQWWAGLRVSELLGLSLDDFKVEVYDKEKEWQTIKVRHEGAKFGKERTAWLPTNVYQRVVRNIKQRANLSINFAQKLDEGENVWGFRKSAYNKLLNRKSREILGRVYNTHSLRHGRATDLINKGVPIEKVKEIMGHADIGSTQVYVHLSDSDIEGSLK